MKFGVVPPTISPICTGDYVRTVAAHAEDLGFDSYWAPEHVVLFDDYASRTPYGGKLAITVGGPVDPFSVLTIAASATSHIRLGTGICLVAQRNPVYTAKAVASLDWLSGGRFDFGVGIGWLREEFEAVAVPWARRGPRALACLEVMRRLWTDGIAEYHGEFYDLPPCRQDPTPVQKPHPPIILGGETDAALRRVAKVGQGWYGFNHDPPSAAERVARLGGLLAERGRDIAEVQVHITPDRRHPIDRGIVADYAAAGVHQLLFIVGGRDAESTCARLDELAARVL